jgi:hypothetical protein
MNGKGIDNKIVLQHLDFRENGILLNPDCNGKLSILLELGMESRKMV